MQMSQQEYKELMNILKFFNSKVEDCYSDETTKYLYELEQEYKKYITN